MLHTYVALGLWDSLSGLLTHGVSSGVLTQLSLSLSVWPLVGLLGQTRWHCGSCDHSLEATLPLLYIHLRVEDNYVYLGHVEHAQCYRGTEVHGDGQGGRLNVQLEETQTGKRWLANIMWMDNLSLWGMNLDMAALWGRQLSQEQHLNPYQEGWETRQLWWLNICDQLQSSHTVEHSEAKPNNNIAW